MTLAAQLEQAIAIVCPVVGVSIGKVNDRTTWKFRPQPSATLAQQRAAQAVIDAFTPQPEVDESVSAKVAALEIRLAALERRP